MSEKLAEVFEQYDLKILEMRKGRGATILDTTDGMMILEPFRGNIVRLEQEYVLKRLFIEKGFSKLDMIIPNKDGIFFTCDRYRQPFVLKRHFEGNECDMHSAKDMIRSIKLLAVFHQYGRQIAEEFDREWKVYQQEKEEKRFQEIKEAFLSGEEIERIAHLYDIQENILCEMLADEKWFEAGENGKEKKEEIAEVLGRHNRELKKIYKYMRKVKKKNSFETLFLKVFEEYYEQGCYCVEQLEKNKEISLEIAGQQHYGICHGACNQHNILLAEMDNHEDEGMPVSGVDNRYTKGEYGAIVHFERFSKGNQLNDLYQFARKAMEKNHFDFELLGELLNAYSEENTLSKEDYRYIYILFSYPEKFWKIANGYYNSNKAFLSPKYVEKLQNVICQENEKREMLEKFRTLQDRLDFV